MTVHHLRGAKSPKDTRGCLTKLLAQEQAGKLKGLAFVAILEVGFVADACGIAHDDPDRTLQMVAVLESKLARRARGA